MIRTSRQPIFGILIVLFLFVACAPKPERAQELLQRGVEKTAEGQYEEAIRLYTRAILLKPDFAMVYTYRGSAKFDSKDYDGALKDYTKAIEIDPYYADPYDYRGRLKMLLHDVEGACDDFKKAEALGKSGMYEKTRHCP